MQAIDQRGVKPELKSRDLTSGRDRIRQSNALLSTVAAEIRNFSSESLQNGRAIPNLPAMAAIVCVKGTEKYVREDESVAVNPFGVLGVESHELVPHDVGNRGQAHRGTRMAGVCLECGIDL